MKKDNNCKVLKSNKLPGYLDPQSLLGEPARLSVAQSGSHLAGVVADGHEMAQHQGRAEGSGSISSENNRLAMNSSDHSRHWPIAAQTEYWPLSWQAGAGLQQRWKGCKEGANTTHLLTPISHCHHTHTASTPNIWHSQLANI
ncbi:hypothetical protein E2C01_017900 [Portunus trituberculatus]|uniref:Uncharacterized protein n=1 Tax=Portunus trituberculatus TaxID=210409 RepID=A0A5B7DV30_PORTR|nr:hypothetical protein [Portunus trituberculatus]